MTDRATRTHDFDVSVLIATRNRSHLLRQTLEHLVTQNTGNLLWEVIVIDNGSDDDTPDVLEMMKDRLPLVTLSETTPGKNRALNRGLDVARGRLYVFTDNDTLPAPQWLAEMHAAACRWPDATIFAGRIEPSFPANAPDWSKKGEGLLRSAYGWYVRDQEEGYTDCLPYGANMAVRASVFGRHRYLESIGPSGEHYAMGSEAELLLRLASAGEKVVYIPFAKVLHVIEAHQVTRSWLHGRAFRYGWGMQQLAKSNVGGRHVGGMPLWVLREAVEAGLLHLLGFVRNMDRRIHWEMCYWRMRGYWHGLRQSGRDSQA